MSKLEQIASEAGPLPHGHYAQAVVHGATIYVSGQLGIGAGQTNPERISVGEQVRHALLNVEAILSARDCQRTDIAKVTLYITDVAYWAEANAAFAEFFGDHRPARSIVPCAALHLGAKIEIDTIAALA